MVGQAAGLLFGSWGGRTRTHSYRTKTCRATGYTTPQSEYLVLGTRYLDRAREVTAGEGGSPCQQTWRRSSPSLIDEHLGDTARTRFDSDRDPAQVGHCPRRIHRLVQTREHPEAP